MIPSPSTSQTSPNLSTALSSLTNLITLSHQTLQNPQFLPPKPSNDQFVPCPYNPHHLMPPESLFLHTLRCPLPLAIDPQNYQTTLHTSSSYHHHNTNFTLPDITQDLCLSIDDYLSCSGYSSFFYQDCPAVVSLSDVDASRSNTSKKTFTLPGFLSVECDNVVCCDGDDMKRKVEGFGEVEFRVLASDLWFVRREIEGWSDYEYINVCSFNVVCAISRMRMLGECDLKKWLVVNSPRYGVVIDVYIRDHMFVLVDLCLRAVVKEALGFVELAKEREAGLALALKSMSFECPLLTQALTWLGSQLGLLYGNVNGKLFAISMFKHCVLESASKLLFALDGNRTEPFDFKCGQRNLISGNNNIRGLKIEETDKSSDSEEGGTVDSKVVFVSQVAAAIAALHERSWLEEKIRALRVSQPLTSYQRMAEHLYFSSRADEERKSRPNYRPIIEHDGLPRQHSVNQETNKAKTREELLAEERDYKRRRMSYRGKKVKRTTLQVTRDIIEDYMEEIKKAGGIGCFEKGDEEGEIFSSELSSYYKDADDHRTSKCYSSELSSVGPKYDREHFQYDYDFKSIGIEDSPRNDQSRRESFRHRDHLEDHRSSTRREKYGREYHDRSSERHRSHARSYERSSRKEREDENLTKSKHNKVKRSSSSRSYYSDDRSSYLVSDTIERSTHDGNTSSHVPNAFEDRYDPSQSHDSYEYDVVNGNKDIQPE